MGFQTEVKRRPDVPIESLIKMKKEELDYTRIQALDFVIEYFQSTIESVNAQAKKNFEALKKVQSELNLLEQKK